MLYMLKQLRIIAFVAKFDVEILLKIHDYTYMMTDAYESCSAQRITH